MTTIETRPLDLVYDEIPDYLREIAVRIVAYLTRNPPATTEVIAASLGIDRDLIGCTLDWLDELVEDVTLHRPRGHVVALYHKAARLR